MARDAGTARIQPRNAWSSHRDTVQSCAGPAWWGFVLFLAVDAAVLHTNLTTTHAPVPPLYETYTPAFKAQVVQELLKETKTITQLAAEHSVHPHVLREWKVTVLKGMASLFEKGDSVEALRAAYDQQLEERYAQIGRLTTQVTWLKKKSGLDPDKN